MKSLFLSIFLVITTACNDNGGGSSSSGPSNSPNSYLPQDIASNPDLKCAVVIDSSFDISSVNGTQDFIINNVEVNSKIVSSSCESNEVENISNLFKVERAENEIIFVDDESSDPEIYTIQNNTFHDESAAGYSYDVNGQEFTCDMRMFLDGNITESSLSTRLKIAFIGDCDQE